MIEIPIVLLEEDAVAPRFAKPGDAGADLVARESVTLAPGGGRAMVSTGIAIAIPEGYAGFVLPRSGLAINHGITCVNSPGLIDSGYRGELKVVLLNTDPTTPYVVNVGDRIAQLVIMAVENAPFVLSESLPESERGEGGFGHSGK